MKIYTKIYSMKSYFFILTFLILAACTGDKKAESTLPTPTVEEVKIKKIKKKIALSTKKELLTEGEVLLDIAYPQFGNAGNEQTTTSLNNLIKSMIDTTIARFKDQNQGIDANTDEKIDTIMVQDSEISSYKGMANMIGRTLFITYTINYQTPEYIEIAFGFDVFTGGAHGIPYTFMLHYDLAGNKDTGLKDIFVENTNYLGLISKLCAEDLTARQTEIATDSTFITEGTQPKDSNFKNFTISGDTLKFSFDPYAVASFAAGPQEVKIPFSKIESILNKNSVAIKAKK